MAKKPATPETESAAPAPEPAPEVAPKKPAEPAPVDAGPTKKKQTPGKSPPIGKKLKNHLKNQQQRLAKEGAVEVRKAVSILKSMKRAKFDETVEIHMHL